MYRVNINGIQIDCDTAVEVLALTNKDGVPHKVSVC